MKILLSILIMMLPYQHLKAQFLSQEVRYDRWLPGSVEKQTFDSLTQTIDSFFSTMNNSYMANDYWLQSDFDDYVAPYRYLISAKDYWNFSTPLVPYVMSFKPIKESNDYLVMLSYLGHVDSNYEMIYGMYYVIATKDTTNSYKLKHPEKYFTKDWEKKAVGSIDYIISPNRKFNAIEAQKMDSFNRWTANYFKTDIIRVKYFSCADVKEFYLIQGEENFALTGKYITAIGGGIGDGFAKSIYTAARSEYYPHELIHIYIEQENNRRIRKSQLAYEGVPTYLGGSRGLYYQDHLKNVAQYVRKNKIDSIATLISIPGNPTINNDETDIIYAVGSLIAKLIDDKLGYKGLIQLFNTPKNNIYKYLAETYNIPVKEADAFLMSELKKYE